MFWGWQAKQDRRDLQATRRLVVHTRAVHTSGVPERDQAATAVFIELLLIMVSIAVVVFAIGLLFSGGGLPTLEDLGPAQMLLTPLCWVLAGALYRAFGTRLDDPGEQRAAVEARPGAAAAWREVGIHCLLAIVGSTLLAQLLGLVGLEVAEQEGVKQITSGGFALRADLLFLALSAIVAAPLAEEWLFRGLFFRRLLAVGSPAAAFTLSAILFALIHGNPAGFLIYVWLGVVFARVFLRTGRLWTAVAVHVTNNLVTMAFLVFLPNLGEPSPNAHTDVFAGPQEIVTSSHEEALRRP